jgi:hypothetical protein
MKALVLALSFALRLRLLPFAFAHQTKPLRETPSLPQAGVQILLKII